MTAALTAAECDTIRELCGYGKDAAGDHRAIFQARCTLTGRLKNLNEAETARARFYMRSIADLQPDDEGVQGAEPPRNAALILDWRESLCEWLGVPPGPGVKVAA